MIHCLLITTLKIFYIATFHISGSRESRRLCDEAMKNGHVKSQINKIVLYGPGGAGKSSFLEMVTGNSPPEVRVALLWLPDLSSCFK